MTYAELVASVRAWCEYDEADFLAEIPRFIRMAEDRIAGDMTLPIFRKQADITLAANAGSVTAPTDLLSSISLAVILAGVHQHFALHKEPDWLAEAISPDLRAAPRYYAQSDQATIIVAPRADVTYTLRLSYRARPASLVDTTGGTWLSRQATNAMIHATLINAGIFMRQEEATMAKYEANYAEAIALLGGVSRRTKSDEYRRRPRREDEAP